MICLAPMLALLGVVTVQPNHHHTTNMDGVQVEVQSCVEGFGVYATATSSELYTGGVQYGLAWQATPALALIAQPHVGVSYPSRWVPELPNQVQFDAGVKLLAVYRRLVVELGWQHDSHGGLGRDVTRDGMRYGNTGLDLVKFGVGWVL